MKQLKTALLLLIMGSPTTNLFALNGLITKHDKENKSVTINLGQNQGITAGTYLYVYKIKRQKEVITPTNDKAKKEPVRYKWVKKRGRKVGLVKVTEVFRTTCIARIHRIHMASENLEGHAVWYDGLSLEDRVVTHNMAPRMLVHFGGGFGKVNGYEFRRDRWAAGDPNTAVVSDDGKEVTTTINAHDIPNISVFTGLGEIILYPLAFSRTRNIWTDLFGIGVLGQYDFVQGFQSWADKHLFGPEATSGQNVAVNGYILDLDTSLYFRLGKTFTRDFYGSLALKFLPLNLHKIALQSGTLDSLALMKQFTFTFMSIGVESELVATSIFDFRVFFHYPLPIGSKVSQKWQNEGVKKEPETDVRSITYANPRYYKFGAILGVGYKTFKFHVFTTVGEYSATGYDGMEVVGGVHTADDTGMYKSSAKWITGGATIGGTF